MPDLGSPEVIILVIIAIWFFGAKKLKGFARRLGESTKEIKKIQKELDIKGDETEE